MIFRVPSTDLELKFGLIVVVAFLDLSWEIQLPPLLPAASRKILDIYNHFPFHLVQLFLTVFGLDLSTVIVGVVYSYILCKDVVCFVLLTFISKLGNCDSANATD